MDSKVNVNNVFEYNDASIYPNFEIKEFQMKAFDISRKFTPGNIHNIEVR